jgi:hypothetical protein
VKDLCRNQKLSEASYTPQRLSDCAELWEIAPGPFPDTRSIVGVPIRVPLPGSIRKDPSDGSPQSMPNLVYVGVEDVTATLAKIEAHGGAIHAPRFEVPGVVVLGLFKDPAGKLMGLIEMHDGRPKIP